MAVKESGSAGKKGTTSRSKGPVSGRHDPPISVEAASSKNKKPLRKRATGRKKGSGRKDEAIPQ